MVTFAILSFLTIFAISLLAIGAAYRYFEQQRKRQMKGILQAVTGEREMPNVSILMESAHAREGLDSYVTRFNFARDLERKIKQAGLDWKPAGLLIMMAVLGAAGFFIGLKVRVLIFWEVTAPVLAAFFAALPYLYVMHKRKKRLDAFEEQFPEALDFLARSMRAGHAFSISLEMLGQESPEPLGGEFRTVFNEQNLGAPVEQALTSLAERVPLLDVRFFVSCVLLQRQTGGNLSEVLVRLAQVIRDRFRLKGQVRAASAHGRLTAVILFIMPIVTTLLLFIVAPTYLPLMANDPDGKYMILGSIILQFIGYFWMRKIINIKV